MTPTEAEELAELVSAALTAAMETMVCDYGDLHRVSQGYSVTAGKVFRWISDHTYNEAPF
jgi:hypothetical protein